MPWSILDAAPAGAGAFAPIDATYVVVSLNALLTNERVLTAGVGIALVDAGAGSTLTIDATSDAGPWDETGTVVHLDTATNTVAIGVAVMSGIEKVRVVGAAGEMGILSEVTGTGASFVPTFQGLAAHTGTGQFIGLFVSGTIAQTGGAFAGSIIRSTLNVAHTGGAWAWTGFHCNSQITAASGTATQWASFHNQTGKTGAGTVTDMIGYLSAPSGGGGTVTRYYGFFATAFALPTTEIGGFFQGASAAIEVGTGTPSARTTNGVWFEDGDLVVNGSAMAGTEVFRTVGDARVEGKLKVTGAIAPLSLALSDPAAGTALFIESDDGLTAPVSGAATGRLRYNDTTATWQISVQTGAYTDIGTTTNAFMQNGNSFGALATLGTNDANALAFETGGVERMRLLTGGELIIGGTAVITSSDEFVVVGSSTSGVRASVRNTNSAGFSSFICFNDGAVGPSNCAIGMLGTTDAPTSGINPGDGFILAGNDAVSLVIASGAGTGGPIRFATDAVERARILSSGQLLVGRTAVAAARDISNFQKNQNLRTRVLVDNTTNSTLAASEVGVLAAGATTANLAIIATSDLFTPLAGMGPGEGVLRSTTGLMVLLTIAANPIVFRTNATEEMRLLSGGGLLINATTQVGAEQLRVTAGRTLLDFTSTTTLEVAQTGGGTPALVVDTTNTRVGIGIAVPTVTLEVVGAILATTVDATTDFTVGATVITDGVITDAGGLQIAAALDMANNTISNVGAATNDWTATGITTAGSVAIGIAGSDQGTLTLAGVTSGVVTVAVAAAAGTWTMTLPTGVAGVGGEQLTDAAGNGVTSWAAAASNRASKNIKGEASPQDALGLMLSTKAYRFHYKKGHGTKDYATEYVGPVAEEAPWAMHYGRRIVNPVNTLGYMLLGFQAQGALLDETRTEIQRLKDRIATLEGA